ncbi:uncharacterized protein FOMMEDRAFT_101733 [Fomitiporia mediterranea MF3/22]|uniref:uncharacterized protein n=1 Tax=Fomitiporia mediterranea (strain MF3/22) TaxID=694068 RepID=UPI0004409A16|nr:uncharacterized protein FOMMEDRAFT_101733 [Fomitiporia mediterranea MF3/22]EJD08292.1 hypothetical protein FOMMEDRAFT_101733 [Fomitiporia mediterranea MF3/22]
MDPFEVRMHFLSLLRRLNASQQSIQKVVAYALKYFSRCGEDLWDCVVEECQKGSLNTRINILYLLDSLCETSLLSKASFGPSNYNNNLYVDFVARDLAMIVDYVVPQSREGLINLMSAVQILENWRNKRIIDPQKIDDVLAKLESQKAGMHAAAMVSDVQVASDAERESLTFSRPEVFKRIEEDRERHKRLRERRWVQPVSHMQAMPLLASFAPLPPDQSPGAVPASSITQTDTVAGTIDPPLPLDIEFDNEWETTSDWNEDDEEAIAEENALCYPNAATRLGGNAEIPASLVSGVAPVMAKAPSIAEEENVSAQAEPPKKRIKIIRTRWPVTNDRRET